MSLYPLSKKERSHKEELSKFFGDKYRRAFNPSLLEVNENTHLTFRHTDGPNAEVKAFYTLTSNSSIQVTCLSDINKSEYRILKVCDPKLFQFKGGIWITFNNGYVKQGNQIYAQQVFPKLLPPILVERKNRRLVEKNWGFFEQDEKLYSIYSIDPVSVFEVDQSKEGCWILKDENGKNPTKTKTSKLTIGTQPIRIGNDLLLIAHRKFSLITKRIYLGMPVSLRLVGGQWKTYRNKKLLFHSYRSLLGNRERLNSNLISCSYFSGLCLRSDRVLLTYGINDLDWSATELSLKQLCN